PDILKTIESKTYDMRFQIRGARAVRDVAAVVAIDEKSINKLGRIPWTRTTMARLLDAISSYRPKVIGIDFIFSEPEVSEGLKAVKELKGSQSGAAFSKKIRLMEREFNADLRLETSLKKAGNVVLPLVFIVPVQGTVMAESIEPFHIMGAQYLYVKEGGFSLPFVAQQALTPLERFAEGTAAMGHIYTSYDADGTIRREPLSVRFKDSYYPSFGLEIARLYLGIDKDDAELITGAGIGLKDRFIPTDESGSVLIDYAGPAGTIPTYSAIDVIEGSIPADALNGRAVLLGTTAIGAYDIHVTPYANMPGVEKQASVVEGVVTNRFIVRSESQWLIAIAIIIVSAFVLGAGLPMLHAITGAGLSVIVFVGSVASVYHLFASKGLWIDLITPSLNVFFQYAAITGYRYMTEERKAKEIKSIFSSYVTPKIVNELMRNPEMAKLGGARKDVTILFSDIRGFTSFSEKRQPEEVVAILNDYLTSMTGVVFRWDGTLDKFVGDAVMVFWGAPLEQKNHAELAVRCALDMMKKLRQLQEKWVKEGKEPFDIGIGINTG
ncbi:MAG: adenylate/guanylate cyclase domain-containing protein, partial [Deltaproteobacteria bacterium]|nr:adenylate/guanylate cyclase domain-containing protein [Deltaproteobacteria bacterium]